MKSFDGYAVVGAVAPVTEELITISPYNLVQETLPRDEHFAWRVAATCCLFNRTHGRQVRPMADAFFALCPTPVALLSLDLDGERRAVELLRPLGFQNRRWSSLKLMSADFIAGKPHNKCHGVGPYALDAIDIFVHGRTDFEPTDKWLQPYVAWLRTERRRATRT